MRAITLPLALSCASALLITPSSPQPPCARVAAAASSKQPRMCAFDDSPSDSGDDDLTRNTMDTTTTAVTEMPAATAHDDEQRRTELRMQLLALAAGCCRGEAATDDDLRTMRATVTELEELNPTPEPTRSPSCAGTWELSLSDTQLFRSSPFFMAGRAVCAEGEEARRYDWFCDMHRAALAISTIGKVRQIVSADAIVSEFETTVGSVPFVSDFVPVRYSGGLPLAITGSIVSTASIEANLGDAHQLLMDTVEIKGSNVPGLRTALDAGVRLPTRELGRAIETVNADYANPRPLFRTTYLDEAMRIARDQDGKLFVYSRVSDSTLPTDYSAAKPDLGLTKLVEGLSLNFLPQM